MKLLCFKFGLLLTWIHIETDLQVEDLLTKKRTLPPILPTLLLLSLLHCGRSLPIEIKLGTPRTPPPVSVCEILPHSPKNGKILLRRLVIGQLYYLISVPVIIPVDPWSIKTGSQVFDFYLDFLLDSTGVNNMDFVLDTSCDVITCGNFSVVTVRATSSQETTDTSARRRYLIYILIVLFYFGAFPISNAALLITASLVIGRRVVTWLLKGVCRQW